MKNLTITILLIALIASIISISSKNQTIKDLATPVLSEVTSDKWVEKIQDSAGNIHYDTISRYIVVKTLENPGNDVYSILLPDNSAYDGLSIKEVNDILQGKDLQ